jgi:hypothetical protein
VAAPEWPSLAFLPGHRGVVDSTDWGSLWLSWWLDIQVALLKAIAQSYGEGLLDYPSWRMG